MSLAAPRAVVPPVPDAAGPSQPSAGLLAVMAVFSWLRGTLAIARKEVLTLFVTPLAYVVGTLFLLEQGWNFSLLLRFLNDPLAAPGPVMQFYFGGSFFIFWLPVIFLCATLTMRTLAEERRMGTLEALMTAPVEPSQVVLGKYAGALTFYVLLWLPTSVFYVLLLGATSQGPGGRPELGPIASGYLGTFLIGASFLAIGVMASALARNQLAAAISSSVLCTIGLLAGLLVDQVSSETLSSVLEWTSLLSMMQEMAAGIVDGRYLAVHVGLVIAALTIATVAIDPRRDLQRIFQTACVLVAVTAMAAFAGRHAQRRDWTAGAVYTLSERAGDILRGLERPVDVTVIVPSQLGGGRANPVRAELREVLMRMAKESAQLRVRLLDPDRDRTLAEQLLVDYGLSGRELGDGVVLIRSGEGTSLRRAWLFPSQLVTYANGADVMENGPRVESFRGEEALLGKFIEVSEEQRRTACYTQGHGEAAFDNLEPYAGYAHLRDLLRESNLETKVAELDGETALEGCDLLVVAGPSGTLPTGQVQAIEKYVQEGGRLLVLSGAVVLRGRDRVAEIGLEPLLARYGIRMGDRLVLSPHPMPGASDLLSFTLQEGFGDHEAVRSLIGRPVSMVAVRELSVEGKALPLLSVGEDSWAESDIAAITMGLPSRYDAGSDRGGPIPVAAVSELGSTRVIVIASDQFAVNALLREDIAYDHGRDFILNCVGWLLQRDALMGIRPRPREHVKLVLAPEQLERMTLICLIALPGFAAALGLMILWRRRQ